MVEGRTDSVDLILSEAKKAGLKFEFKAGYSWASQRNRYIDALPGRHHCFFIFE
jgi:hypothetical protein